MAIIGGWEGGEIEFFCNIVQQFATEKSTVTGAATEGT